MEQIIIAGWQYKPSIVVIAVGLYYQLAALIIIAGAFEIPTVILIFI